MKYMQLDYSLSGLDLSSLFASFYLFITSVPFLEIERCSLSTNICLGHSLDARMQYQAMTVLLGLLIFGCETPFEAASI